MYLEKESGKNQYWFFDEFLKNIAIERSQIEVDSCKMSEQGMLELLLFLKNI